jgi:glycosyltransferase involved in cell wall biosynthesis
MKVSILVTTYNCEAYIDNTIKSVVEQEMPFSWELLIGDDGSTDATRERVSKWMDLYPENIHMYVMERGTNVKKDGTRAARNRANLLEKATGEYLIFLDGDDQFLGKEKIKKEVEILDSPKFQNCSCVAHNIVANNIKEGKKYPLVDIALKEGIIPTQYYWTNLYFHTNTILFRSKCKKLMLKPVYRDYLNDNFITYIIIQYGSIYYLNKLWAQYNLTGDGLWTGKKRTYGCFRNLIIYDLQLDINKSFSKASFLRHLYDFNYIFKYYNASDREKVDPLVLKLDKDLFHYTWLMYRFDSELKPEEKQEKKKLKFKVKHVQLIRSIENHLPFKKLL